MSCNTSIRYKQYQNIRHCTIEIFLKCPKCLLESKNIQRVKTHKSLSGLDSHLSTFHKGEEYWTAEVRVLLRQFAEAMT